jgi:hypothetical protein
VSVQERIRLGECAREYRVGWGCRGG